MPPEYKVFMSNALWTEIDLCRSQDLRALEDRPAAGYDSCGFRAEARISSTSATSYSVVRWRARA